MGSRTHVLKEETNGRFKQAPQCTYLGPQAHMPDPLCPLVSSSLSHSGAWASRPSHVALGPDHYEICMFWPVVLCCLLEAGDQPWKLVLALLALRNVVWVQSRMARRA